jgi:hypothetical protein
MGIPIGGSHVDNVRQYNLSTYHKDITLAFDGKRFPPNLQAKLELSKMSLDFFDYHESSGTFVLGIHVPHNEAWRGVVVATQFQKYPRSLGYDVVPVVVDLPRIEISSLQITPNNNIITTTYGGGRYNSLLLSFRADLRTE